MGRPSVTYARARLRLGVTGVGTLVVLAAALLLADVPARTLTERGGTPGSDAASLALVSALAALFTLPFDVLGGYVLPRRYARPHPSAVGFARAWLRGVGALLLVTTGSGTLLLAAGRVGGRPAALLAFAVVLGLMILLQEPLARWVGGLRRVPAPAGRAADSGRRPIVLAGADPGFSGGFTGAFATPVLPEHWSRALDPNTRRLLLERRRLILKSGAWRRSLALAAAWNVAGFLLASLVPGAGVRTLSELVATALGFTIWTFLGLLVLPAPSRRATVAADARVASTAEARSGLAAAVRRLDRMQDDEPERSPALESIFHPVPSVAGRVRALEEPSARPTGAWHLARTALYLSHAGLSLLPRAVHCNAGRPELWVYLPADG